MRKALSLLACVVVFLVAAPLVALAQTGTVAFDYSVPAPGVTPAPAVVTGYTARLYVNGVAFIVNDTCVAAPAPAVTTCTGPLPNISTALATVGPNQFLVSLQDGILEGPKSAVPLSLTAPSAPSTPRIQ